MRALLLCLVPCYLLSAAPSATPRDVRPPERTVSPPPPENRPLPDALEMERLAREQPTEFLRWCLIRYTREVTSYRLTMSKQERIRNELQSPEVMQVAFREKPFSVCLKWDEGARKADRVLYVAGENHDRLLARPTPFLFFVAKNAGLLNKDGLKSVDPQGDEARESGRFFITEFGLFNGLARLCDDWRRAEEQHALHVEYLGEQKVPKGGNRLCWVLHRTRFLKPERDGVTEQTAYIDKETWLQVGSVANGKDGLIGAYFYRDIEKNPTFDPEQFQPAWLKR
jgi:hypothetical protein